MKIIVSPKNVYKFISEYINVFKEYTYLELENINNITKLNCSELILINEHIWKKIPDYIFKLPFVISFWNIEQLINERKISILENLNLLQKKCGYNILIYDYNLTNIKVLNENNFKTKYIPYISTEIEINFLSSLKRTKKEYDICFIGCLNNRRENIINELKKNNIRVLLITQLYGNKRDYEISKCNFILNIHFEEYFNIFESIRCNRFLQSGYNIISEDSIDIERTTKNLNLFTYDKIVEKTIDLINKKKHFDEFINYIKDCLKPKNNCELIEADIYSSNIYENLIQDGIMIIENLENINQINKGSDCLFINNNVILRKNFPLQIDWLKNDGKIKFDNSRIPLYRRFIPPPIETINHIFIISKIILATSNKNKNYIEYGVRTGVCVEKISEYVNNIYCVDICDYKPQKNNIFFYKMLTDEFSEKILNTLNFDYAFIDADHSHKQVMKDFMYIFDRINTNGYIFLHDTYPCEKKFLSSDYCNDCYLTPLKIREKFPLIEMLTLPINPGFTIIRKS